MQLGGELTDFIVVLRNTDAVKAFCGRGHLSVGASLSAAAGPLGRSADADLRAGDGGAAACYSYSCSKGMRWLAPSNVREVMCAVEHLGHK